MKPTNKRPMDNLTETISEEAIKLARQALNELKTACNSGTWTPSTRMAMTVIAGLPNDLPKILMQICVHGWSAEQAAEFWKASIRDVQALLARAMALYLHGFHLLHTMFPAPESCAPGPISVTSLLDSTKPLTRNEALRLFGAEKGVSLEALHAEYRRLLKEYHPDTVRSEGPQAIAVAEHRRTRLMQAWNFITVDLVSLAEVLE